MYVVFHLLFMEFCGINFDLTLYDISFQCTFQICPLVLLQLCSCLTLPIEHHALPGNFLQLSLMEFKLFMQMFHLHIFITDLPVKCLHLLLSQPHLDLPILYDNIVILMFSSAHQSLIDSQLLLLQSSFC